MNNNENIGDIYFDNATNTYSINVGNGANGISAYTISNTINQQPKPALTILDGTVKFGEFEIPVDHLEIILKQLYDDVRKNNPEHFI